MQRVAVLSGTGMLDLANADSLEGTGFSLTGTEELTLETPWGEVPTKVVTLADDSGGERRLFFIHRHHHPEGWTTPPHKIEHRANVAAARATQPDALVSICSVGAIDHGFPPGTVGLARQTLDLTGRVWTFHDEDAAHADMTDPFDRTLSGLLEMPLGRQEVATDVEPCIDQVVAVMNGPQFESSSEVEALHRLGATCVSMTLAAEARLTAETEMRHLGLMLSSNWGAGRTPGDSHAPIDHHAVEALAEQMQAVVWECILALLRHDE